MKRLINVSFSTLLLLLATTARAQNPFVQTWCTSDPAPMVSNGTLYVYTGHDEDHADFFYHTGKLPGGGGFGRSVAVEEFQYQADGSFPTILPTDEGVRPIATFNPYRRVEAEIMAFSRGIKTEQNDAVGVYVTDIHNGDYIKLQNVDFSHDIPRTFTARIASGLRGGSIELHIDSLGGQLLGTLTVPATGGWEQWQTITTDLTAIASGTHDLFFAFIGRKGPKLFNFDWWEMKGLEQVNMPLFQSKYTGELAFRCGGYFDIFFDNILLF